MKSMNGSLWMENESQHDSNDDDPPRSGSSTSTPEDEKPEVKTHQGKLLLDATCAPANIKYPTDLELVNEGRRNSITLSMCLMPRIAVLSANLRHIAKRHARII